MFWGLVFPDIGEDLNSYAVGHLIIITLVTPLAIYLYTFCPLLCENDNTDRLRFLFCPFPLPRHSSYWSLFFWCLCNADPLTQTAGSHVCSFCICRFNHILKMLEENASVQIVIIPLGNPASYLAFALRQVLEVSRDI